MLSQRFAFLVYEFGKGSQGALLLFGEIVLCMRNGLGFEGFPDCGDKVSGDVDDVVAFRGLFDVHKQEWLKVKKCTFYGCLVLGGLVSAKQG